MSDQRQPQKAHCPECGALMVNGMTCWGMLGAIIAWEYQNPALMAEHFLTMASYNLQHPAQFTYAALAGLQAVFRERLDQGLALTEIRRRVGTAAAGAATTRTPYLQHRPATPAPL